MQTNAPAAALSITTARAIADPTIQQPTAQTIGLAHHCAVDFGCFKAMQTHPAPKEAACYHSRVLIPHDQLEPETLRSVIAEFATRDGTELTDADVKVDQVMRGLRSGRLVITWDEESASCNIVAVRDLPSD